MKCPSCGVDIEKWENDQEKQRKEYHMREKFEEIHGDFLKPIREKKRFIYFLIGGAIGASFYLGFMIFLFTSGGEHLEFFRNNLKLILVTTAVMGAVSGFVFSIDSNVKNTKEEKKLWNDFCLTHPIE